MGLMKCKECGGDASTNAKACPGCGAPVPKSGKTVLIQIILTVVMFSVFLVTCNLLMSGDVSDSPSIDVIAKAINPTNKWGIEKSDLREKDNPKGEGVFVYIKNPQVRKTVWVVIDGYGYCVNGPSKTVTPHLPWPKAAPVRWEKTGLDMYSATEEIKIVYGE